MAGNLTSGPVNRVSPMANAPGFVRPMTSPANPSVTVTRSLANRRCGAVSATVRPVRATLTCPFADL